MREPLQPPDGNSNRHIHYIEIRHPAYPRSEPPLLRLAAVENDDQDVAVLDHNVALLACGIITGNTWATGYLATQTGDKNYAKVHLSPNGMLHDAEYFYFIYDHSPDYKYNVIISFDHWRFPHGNLPTVFQETVIPRGPSLPSLRGKAAALARDVTCRITGDDTPVEAAHFVPDANKRWFLSNQMNRYAPFEADPTNDACNLISLRRDLHYLFDTRRFTFVPRMRENERRLELYVFCPNNHVGLVSKYHNLPSQPLSGISIECVLARFAWTVFSPSIMPFFQGMAEYAARLFNPESGQWEDEKLHGPGVRMKLHLFDRFTQSRGGTSRKRRHSEQDDTESSQLIFDNDSENSSQETLSGRSHKRRNVVEASYSAFAPLPYADMGESKHSTDTELSANQKGATGRSSNTAMACDCPGEGTPDPAVPETLGTACDVLTLATSALSSTMTLTATIRSLQGHNKQALALRRELTDLAAVLGALLKTITSNTDFNFDMLKPLLHGCGKACKEYDELVSSFKKQSTGQKTSVVGWVRQKYLQGDVRDFADMLAGYKSTISIAIANVNIRVATVTPSALEAYKHLLSDTEEDLKLRLQDIDDKLYKLSHRLKDDGSCDDSEWPGIEEEKKLTQHGIEIGAQLSAQIEQFESMTVADSKSYGMLEAQDFVTTGLGVTKASIQAMVAKLRSHEDMIKGQSWRMVPLSLPREKITEELERLQTTKDSIDQCIRLISDANTDATEIERNTLVNDIPLADDAHNFSVSTIGELVTARVIGFSGRSRIIGGQMSDDVLQKAFSKFTDEGSQAEQDIRHGELGTDVIFESRHGRDTPLACLPSSPRA